MQRKSLYGLIIIIISLLCIILMNGCSKKCPGKWLLEDDLEKGLNWRPLKDSMLINEAFSLIDVDITKTSLTCGEECECLIEFDAKVKSIESFYYSFQYNGLFSKIPEWGKGEYSSWEHVNPGKYFEVKGKAYYDYYETGWKIRQFDAPVLDEKKQLVAKFLIPKISLKDDINFFE